LDEIYPQTVELALPNIRERFDLVICADVLEHLLDPAAVLRGLRTLVDPAGHLLVSVPNIRYFPAIVRIAVGAGFRPDPSGTFDSTHIRFFTRANLRDMLRFTGWSVQEWSYPRSTVAGHVRTALGKASRGVTDEWLAAEWFVIAAPQ
jgi:2-polyprenyl-3-methyl-5-hydroxy-6-metoxy-1,4-benzoquinol methylase